METWMTWESAAGDRRVKVTVTDAGVSWMFYRQGLLHTNEIKTRQLLNPRIELIDGSITGVKLIVQYVRVIFPDKMRAKARRAEVVMASSYQDCCSTLCQIEAVIHSNEPHRPKRVVIFINPVSGFKRAVNHYHSMVVPLLLQCGVAVDAIVTKSARHVAEVLEEYDLSSVDAVVSMGGDGAVAQVTNGLIQRAMKDASKGTDDPGIELTKPCVPVACIPSGSGCVVALYTSGALMDIETAVLSIALGHREEYDVLGIRHEGESLGYANIVAGCGVFSERVTWLERIRDMGLLRYWLVLPTAWWSWFRFPVTIDYLPVSKHRRRLGAECDTPLPDHVQITQGPWPGWETLHCYASEVWVTQASLGDFLMQTQKGAYHEPNLATGSAILDVHIAENFWDSAKWYQAMFAKGRAFVPREYMEQIEVSAFRVRGLQSWPSDSLGPLMHVDMEAVSLQQGASFEGKVHPGLLSFLCLNRDLIAQARGEQES